MTWWRRFDRAEVAADFIQMRRDCGIDFARIFLLWEDFQPDGPHSVAASALENLIQVADAAAEAGILLDVTFFTGHMSGPNWVPWWMIVDNDAATSEVHLHTTQPQRASDPVAGRAPVMTSGSNPYDLCVVTNGITDVHLPPPPQAATPPPAAATSTAVASASTAPLVALPAPSPPLHLEPEFSDAAACAPGPLPQYRNPFTDAMALEAQETLLTAVVGRLAQHPAILLWNLGNEPDLFAIPPSAEAAVAWFRRMKRVIRLAEATAQPLHDVVMSGVPLGAGRPVGGVSNSRTSELTPPRPARHHPVTCGLHCDSLRFASNNLPVDLVFAEADVCTMHSYPMYMPWLRDADPLDATFVPFTCAVVAALVGKRKHETTVAHQDETSRRQKSDPSSTPKCVYYQRPILMEEFGGCTAPPGAPSQVWRWSSYNAPRSQFMAAEEAFAAYVAATLDGLVRVGCLGACLWCWADYSSDLWTLPPCAESWHERYFGIVRPDGTLKPHAAVLRAFASRGVAVVRDPAARLVLADRTKLCNPHDNELPGLPDSSTNTLSRVTLAASPEMACDEARAGNTSAPDFDPAIYYGRNNNTADPLHSQTTLATLHTQCKNAFT
jgi:hypothetical protein